MTTWLNIERTDLPLRALQLVVSWRFKKDWMELTAIAHSPLELELWLKTKLEKNYPQFLNATTRGMHFDPETHGFVFTIQHPDLPIVPDGERIPREPLLREPDIRKYSAEPGPETGPQGGTFVTEQPGETE